MYNVSRTFTKRAKKIIWLLKNKECNQFRNTKNIILRRVLHERVKLRWHWEYDIFQNINIWILYYSGVAEKLSATVLLLRQNLILHAG